MIFEIARPIELPRHAVRLWSVVAVVKMGDDLGRAIALHFVRQLVLDPDHDRVITLLNEQRSRRQPVVGRHAAETKLRMWALEHLASGEFVVLGGKEFLEALMRLRNRQRIEHHPCGQRLLDRRESEGLDERRRRGTRRCIRQ